MNTHQQRVLFSFRRVVNFADERPELTSAANGESAGVAKQLEALKGVVSRATAFATDQHTLAANARGVSKDEAQLRANLVDHHLRSIVTVARGLRGTVPGIGVLTMPASNVGNATLIEVASAFSRQAAIYQDVLAEHGLPADVVAQLDAAINAFRTSVDARGSARSDRRGATRGVAAEITLGRKVVTVLDGVVSRQLKDQPSALTAWKTAKRVTRSATSAAATAVPVSPPAAPGTPTSAPGAAMPPAGQRAA